MAARDVGYGPKITQHMAERVSGRTALQRQNMKGHNTAVLSVAGSFFHPCPFGTGWLYYVQQSLNHTTAITATLLSDDTFFNLHKNMWIA